MSMDTKIPLKSLEDNFSDWESSAIGFGYGSGETHTMPALKKFLGAIPEEGTYDYCELEASVGGATAWLLISILCRGRMIEYGTSPRFAWLTDRGKALKRFVSSKTDDELIQLGCRDHEYSPCSPDSCNCGPLGYIEGRKCPNPFWGHPA